MLSNLKQRTPTIQRSPPDFALYTESASSASRVGDLFVMGASHPPAILHLSDSKSPRLWAMRFNAKNTIFGLEMLAPLDFIYMNRQRRDVSSINLHIGNNNVAKSLVRGDSGTDVIEDTIALFRRLVESYSIDIWLGRAPEKRNPADLPTRHAPIPFKVC